MQFDEAGGHNMKKLGVKVWVIALALVIASAAQADDDPGLLAFIARSNQRCEELKQKRAEIQRQAAQSQTIRPEQKAQAAKTIAELDKAIAATTALLQDPALRAYGDKEGIAARLQFAIAQGSMLVRSAQREMGVSPSSAIDRVLDMNVAPFMTKVSPGFDGAPRASNGDEGPVYHSGTRFFGIGGNSSTPKVSAAYTPTTPQSADRIVQHDGSVGGGIMLEGTAGGLGPVSMVRYDDRYNALVIDNHLVYFMKVPPWGAAALCREILQDKNMLVGVSMGKTSFVFGDRSTYEDTDVGRVLLLTDHFLGDFIFGWRKWTGGYKFEGEYEPQTTLVTSDMLVRFAFKDFQFTRKGDELQLANLAVDVRMMPVSNNPAKDGGMLPDMDALQRAYTPPPEFLANAQYFTSHFDFFRRERIVAKTLAYGELAALFRSFKEAGVELEALAADLERG
jgi:hypothetical protein